MKKYQITMVDTGVTSESEILNFDKALINGNEYNFEYKFLADNVLMLRLNNKNYYFTINENDEEGYLEINLNSRVFKVIPKSELDLILEKLSVNKGDVKDKKEIVSPMPGIISKLNVSEGQKVNKGDVFLVLEAMKMENEIKAKKDCVIKKVNVAEKKSVEKNELLLLLE
ncbi:MAG: hypothetical protein HGGPFJEG_01625 [Ignavibacteria bacterium]|nr:hypothetical protein [Ignavibacteria bacterium]